MTRTPRRAMSAYVVACLLFGLGCKTSAATVPRTTPAAATGAPQREQSQAANLAVPRSVPPPTPPAPLLRVEEEAKNEPAAVRDDRALAPPATVRSADLMGQPSKSKAKDEEFVGHGIGLGAEGFADGALRARSGGRVGAIGSRGYGAAAGGPLVLHKYMMSLPLSAPVAAAAAPAEFNTEAYAHHKDNDFLAVKESPLSTFSIDVDTASYSNVRRFLNQGTRPPADAVRIEELVNYFHYDYTPPHDGKPFSVNAEVGSCPWAPDHRLVRIGVQGRLIEASKVPPRNLVFLIDVSGSMNEPNKLPLLKRGLRLLVDNLRAEDKLAMVVYAGASGVALPTTSGANHARILEAIDRLEAGGSTNGAQGIELAYKLAQAQFDKNGINRVILATDGDFNVGVTSEGELVRLIEEKKKSGVFLTVLGFGSGNLQDARMESLADKGNGNYAYIDTLAEAHKVLVRQAGATLVTIAKDVKLQVEFNPNKVARYRLIGYENRVLAAQDFNDDKKDAGEIGAGHSVTALYEVVPVGAARSANDKVPTVDALRYQGTTQTTEAAASDELLTLKVRYKAPQAEASEKLEFAVRDAGGTLEQASPDFRFAAAVAGFGMLLRGSEYKGSATLARVRELAQQSLGSDQSGDRHELVALMAHAGTLGVE